MWPYVMFSYLLGVSALSNDYQQCAANLACSINYEKTFQEKINSLGYHTTLQLLNLKQSFQSQLTLLERDVAIARTNASEIHDDVTREMHQIFQTLENDKSFLHNLTTGVYKLANELHHEQYVRFQDVHKMVEEMNFIKQKLGMFDNHTSLNNEASCEVKLNSTIHNATFYETQYRKVLIMYNNLQTTVTDIRRQQQTLLVQLQEKTREISRLQKHVITSSPAPAKLSRSVSCGEPIGLEDGRIHDTDISSSESFGSFSSGHARLNNNQGWYTGAKTNSDAWLNINLHTPHVITAIATQGAPCCEVWVTNFTIYYSRDTQTWKEYHRDCSNQYLRANDDQDTILYQELHPPIIASSVRINIVEFHRKNNSASNYIGMRTELYGCPITTPKITQPHQ